VVAEDVSGRSLVGSLLDQVESENLDGLRPQGADPGFSPLANQTHLKQPDELQVTQADIQDLLHWLRC